MKVHAGETWLQTLVGLLLGTYFFVSRLPMSSETALTRHILEVWVVGCSFSSFSDM